jgi:hypothetical protein
VSTQIDVFLELLGDLEDSQGSDDDSVSETYRRSLSSGLSSPTRSPFHSRNVSSKANPIIEEEEEVSPRIKFAATVFRSRGDTLSKQPVPEPESDMKCIPLVEGPRV